MQLHRDADAARAPLNEEGSVENVYVHSARECLHTARVASTGRNAERAAVTGARVAERVPHLHELIGTELGERFGVADGGRRS